MIRTSRQSATKARPKAKKKAAAPKKKAAPKKQPSAASDRRNDDRQPIRLKVVYRNARSLITEYTSSISRGGCRLQSKKELEPGTRFIFDLFARNSETPVNIEGRVAWCKPSATAGTFDVGIQYSTTREQDESLQRVLAAIFADEQNEKARLHPRIPVNLVADDAVDPEMKYLIKDLSRGGVGLRLPAEANVPASVEMRTFVVFAVTFPGEQPLEVGGEVVWTVQGRAGYTTPAIGVAFVGMGEAQQSAIDRLCGLVRPESLTITFGPRKSLSR